MSSLPDGSISQIAPFLLSLKFLNPKIPVQATQRNTPAEYNFFFILFCSLQRLFLSTFSIWKPLEIFEFFQLGFGAVLG